jgi:transcriptional regulator with XRE-family HTH domain
MGMTQRQLAERARTSHSAISRLERARADVTLGTLERIAEALDLELLVGFRARSFEDPLPYGLTGSAQLPEQAIQRARARARLERANAR